MFCHVNRKDFLRALRAISPLARNDALLPILSKALLFLNKSRLFMETTTLDASARVFLPVRSWALADVRCALAPAPLIHFVQRDPSEQLILETCNDGTQLEVTGRITARFALNPKDPSDWPRRPLGNKHAVYCKFQTPAGVFTQRLQQALYAVPKRDSRKALLGVCFSHNSACKRLRLSATTGQFGATTTCEMLNVFGGAKPKVKGALEGMKRQICILPHESALTLFRLASLFPNDNARLMFRFSDPYRVEVAASSDNLSFLLSSKTTDAIYPNLLRVIPRCACWWLRFDLVSFRQALGGLFAIGSRGSANRTMVRFRRDPNNAETLSMTYWGDRYRDDEAHTASDSLQVQSAGAPTIEGFYMRRDVLERALAALPRANIQVTWAIASDYMPTVFVADGFGEVGGLLLMPPYIKEDPPSYADAENSDEESDNGGGGDENETAVASEA